VGTSVTPSSTSPTPSSPPATAGVAAAAAPSSPHLQLAPQAVLAGGTTPTPLPTATATPVPTATSTPTATPVATATQITPAATPTAVTFSVAGSVLDVNGQPFSPPVLVQLLDHSSGCAAVQSMSTRSDGTFSFTSLAKWDGTANNQLYLLRVYAGTAYSAAGVTINSTFGQPQPACGASRGAFDFYVGTLTQGGGGRITFRTP